MLSVICERGVDNNEIFVYPAYTIFVVINAMDPKCVIVTSLREDFLPAECVIWSSLNLFSINPWKGYKYDEFGR